MPSFTALKGNLCTQEEMVGFCLLPWREKGTSIRETCRLFPRAEQLCPALPFSFLKIPVLETLVINTHDFQMSARKRMAHTCNPSFLEVKGSEDHEKNPGWAAQ